MKNSLWEQEDLELRDKEKKVSVRIAYECSQCGHYLCYEEDIRENFCPKCGQRLSWKGVDNGVLIRTDHGLEIREVEE